MVKVNFEKVREPVNWGILDFMMGGSDLVLCGELGLGFVCFLAIF